MKANISPQLCKGCLFCVRFCPKKIIEMGNVRNKKGHFTPFVADEAKCTACAVCATVCPEGAIEIIES
ncbi:MAG: ferredoxin family protein [Oscillospiraceae bacterium]|nr:ferredoxin family protein [Oscillospiraceae bacterium]